MNARQISVIVNMQFLIRGFIGLFLKLATTRLVKHIRPRLKVLLLKSEFKQCDFGMFREMNSL